MPTKILCDTNFLLIPLRFGIDIFKETDEAINDIAEFYVSSKVINEIILLRKDAKPSLEKKLLFALNISKQCKIIDHDSYLCVDESLIELAKKYDMVIGTTDNELRKKARDGEVKVIYLRQRRYLTLDG